MTIGQHAQVQNGLVSIAKALRTATPLVIANPLYRVQHSLVSSIIARENRLRCLSASIPFTQPEIAWMRQPAQKWRKIEKLLPSPDVVDGVRGMSESIHNVLLARGLSRL